MKYYFAAIGFNKIEVRESVSETEHFVTLANGVREKKYTDNQGYFGTWLDAYTFLRENKIADVRRAEARLAQESSRLAAIEAMEPQE